MQLILGLVFRSLIKFFDKRDVIGIRIQLFQSHIAVLLDFFG